MGRLQVRQAVAAAITAAKINYVGTVYEARPTILQESDYAGLMFNAASANGSAAVVVVNITDDKRQRKADTGRGAVNDTNIHSVVLELFFSSTSGDAVAAQLDYDAIVDALIVLIRNNPTMSAPSTVWSAGEFTEGVTHSQGEPYTSEDGLTILIPGVVKFQAWEWLAGTGI